MREARPVAHPVSTSTNTSHRLAARMERSYCKARAGPRNFGGQPIADTIRHIVPAGSPAAVDLARAAPHAKLNLRAANPGALCRAGRGRRCESRAARPPFECRTKISLDTFAEARPPHASQRRQTPSQRGVRARRGGSDQTHLENHAPSHQRVSWSHAGRSRTRVYSRPYAKGEQYL